MHVLCVCYVLCMCYAWSCMLARLSAAARFLFVLTPAWFAFAACVRNFTRGGTSADDYKHQARQKRIKSQHKVTKGVHAGSSTWTSSYVLVGSFLPVARQSCGGTTLGTRRRLVDG